MRILTLRLLGCALAAAGLVAFAGGCASKTGAATKSDASSTQLAEPFFARVQLTLFRVACPAGHLADLDAAALAKKSETARSLEAELDKIGPTAVVTQSDQQHDLRKESAVNFSARIPVVENSRKSGDGPPIQTIHYENVGAILKVQAEPDRRGGWDRPWVNASISAASVRQAESRPAREGFQGTKLDNCMLSFSFPLEGDRPQISLGGTDASPNGGDSAGIVYVSVARLVVTRIKP
ncbi:MAG: hypothetical protein NTW19_06750 [Planctomycetota bacterium]|nr:hypothetical protein [Planctomycetota bacterium]